MLTFRQPDRLRSSIAAALAECMLARPRRTHGSEIVRSSAAYYRDGRKDPCRKGAGDEPEN